MDYKWAKEAAVVLEADYYGPDDVFDVNKDIENVNLTKKECEKTLDVMVNWLRLSPEKKHFGFISVSGHGALDRSGLSILVLNQYNENTRHND